MVESNSLLAHLKPWFYQPIEDRGTEALAFMLTKSDACRTALDALLSDDDFCPGPIARVDTQVFEDSESRPDMVGFDTDDARRLIVESKFWAPLQPRQSWRYYKKLDQARPGVLLFICPRSRIKYLWPEVCAQLEHDDEEPLTLKQLKTSDGTRRAVVVDSENRVILVSWKHLLDRLDEATEEFEVKADIHQLRGLVQRLNDEAFPPLTPDMAAPDFEERDAHLRRMVKDTIARGRNDGWLNTKGLTWGKTKSYHRRYFSVVGASVPWLGLSIEYREDRYERTPMWIMMRAAHWPQIDEPAGMIKSSEYYWLPIHLKPNAVYGDVLEDVVSQLEDLADALCEDTVD